MKTIAMIFIGGGLGSVARFSVGKVSSLFFETNFPLGTLFVNVFACLLVGVLTQKQLAENDLLRSTLVIGFCGGFSTFSTFSKETFQLFAEGKIEFGILSIGLNLILCLLAIYVGMWLIK